MSEGFEVPNRYGAVVNTLTILSSVLISFSGAYFIGVTLSEADILCSTYTLLSDNPNYSTFTKKTIIQVTSIVACFFLFLSLAFAFNVQAFTYDESNYDGELPTENRKAHWKNRKNRNASFAYACFHIALPILGFSIIAFLDGYYLLIAISVIILAIFYVIFG
jgi:hypothetical protein